MIDFRLYAITDRHRCAPTPLVNIVSELLDAGVTAIQLREKDLDDTELIQLAQPIAELCRNYEAKLFINTNTRVAREVGAAGIHLPANTESVKSVVGGVCNPDSVEGVVGGVYNPDSVEGIVGGVCNPDSDENLYAGCSVHSLDAAQKREAEGADFVTYSPIYPTASKPGYGPAVGVKCLIEVTEVVKIPVFALGGITPDRVDKCLAAGAFGVAVMSGVMSPTGVGQQAKRYFRALL